MSIACATNTVPGQEKGHVLNQKIIIISGGKQAQVVYTLGGKNEPN